MVFKFSAYKGFHIVYKKEEEQLEKTQNKRTQAILFEFIQQIQHRKPMLKATL